MANIEELKKIAEEKGVELTEDMLEKVAGGWYTQEEWTKMSGDERQKAIDVSTELKNAGQPCKYWDKDVN